MLRKMLTILLLLGLAVLTGFWAPPVVSVTLLVLYVVGLIAYVVVDGRSPREEEWGRPPCCKHCGYELTGLIEPRCPECGKTIDLQVFE